MFTPQRIAFRIWFIAVCLNTLAGTAYLVIDKNSYSTFFDFSGAASGILFYLCMGFFLTAAFTLPIFLLLILIIRECFFAGIMGPGTLFIVLATSILVTTGTFAGFQFLLGLYEREMDGLFIVAMSSSVVAVLTQAYRLLNHHNAQPETNNL